MNTPIHKILQSPNNIYIKREDFIPFSFGGNKARKAFYFFKEVERLGADCVVTYGSSSSNHCRVVSNMAVSKGLPCYIICPIEKSKITYNSRMTNFLMAKVTNVPVTSVHETIDKTLSNLRTCGKNPYFIAGGGHGILGTQAYVDCYAEIFDFEKTNNIHFDYIFFASGTGTTQAGLICGQILHNDIRKIVGISIARKNPYGHQVVIDSIKEYLESVNYSVPDDVISEATIFIDDYTGVGYGMANLQIYNTLKSVFTNYGIPLDTTYTAKAYYGMVDYISKNNITNKNILFIHTGGTPLFFTSIKELEL